MNKTTKRLPYDVFALQLAKLRMGYYSAKYFWREKKILEKYKPGVRGTMQVFCKNDGAILGGMDEVLAILRQCTGHWDDQERAYELFAQMLQLEKVNRAFMSKSLWAQAKESSLELIDTMAALDDLWVDTHDDLKIRALHDGDQVNACEAVITIDGVGHEFAHLESPYLGILARSTKVATNTKGVVDAAGDKPVAFFADRFDRFENQTADGYAAMKSGALGVATDSMGEWWGSDGLGTNPHALIAFFSGDTTAATLAFAREYPNANAVALVDYHNDCVKTSLEVARAFKKEGLNLWGVRLDTSGNNKDESVQPKFGESKITGVCPQLVWNVRRALDAEGFTDVKNMVSGGFNAAKIAEFEKLGVPVDAYGVGSSILKGNFDFTADVVMVDGKPESKIGREYNPHPALDIYFCWSEIEPQTAD